QGRDVAGAAGSAGEDDAFGAHVELVADDGVVAVEAEDGAQAGAADDGEEEVGLGESGAAVDQDGGDGFVAGEDFVGAELDDVAGAGGAQDGVDVAVEGGDAVVGEVVAGEVAAGGRAVVGQGVRQNAAV